MLKGTRLGLVISITSFLLAASAANATAMRGTFTGEVTGVVGSNLDVGLGDLLAGTFCIETGLAPGDNHPEDADLAVHRIEFAGTPAPANVGFLTSSITVAGQTFRGRVAELEEPALSQLGVRKEAFMQNEAPGHMFQLLRVVDEVGGYNLFLPYSPQNSAAINGDSLVQAFAADRDSGTGLGNGRLIITDPSTGATDVQLDWETTSLVYWPIADVSFDTLVVNIPGIQVDGLVFAVALRLVPGSTPLRFDVLSIAPSSLPAGPGNATFTPATREAHLPAVRLPNGQHVEVRLRLVPGTAQLELTSLSFTQCS